MNLTDSLVELYRKTATILPNDVTRALKESLKKEKKDSNAQKILKVILKNASLAKKESKPICQDTGTPIFYVYYPKKYSQLKLKKSIIKATRIATKKIPLRPNAVNTLTNINSKDNTGEDFPIIHFIEWNRNYLRFDLMLKGGGSENVGLIYDLPNSSLKAGRDLEGIKKCVIDAVFKAQGKGCPPYIVSAGIAGSKDKAFELSKKLFFRKINDRNEDKTLNRLEKELTKKVNILGIGPMGLGGKSTTLDVKIGYHHRHPASFAVAVTFMCWACRRASLTIKKYGVKFG